MKEIDIKLDEAQTVLAKSILDKYAEFRNLDIRTKMVRDQLTKLFDKGDRVKLIEDERVIGFNKILRQYYAESEKLGYELLLLEGELIETMERSNSLPFNIIEDQNLYNIFNSENGDFCLSIYHYWVNAGHKDHPLVPTFSSDPSWVEFFKTHKLRYRFALRVKDENDKMQIDELFLRAVEGVSD